MDVRLGSTLGQIGPKRYKYVTFSASQNVLKVIFKSPRFVLFGANLVNFETKRDIPGHRVIGTGDVIIGCKVG